MANTSIYDRMISPVKNGNGHKSSKDSKSKIAKLCSSIRRSRRQLQRFREERMAAVRLFVGAHWSDQGSMEEMPVNLLNTFVRTVSRFIVPKSPQTMMRTTNQKARPACDGMEKWLNIHLAKYYFEEKFRRFVEDALYCIGIMKVGLGTPATEAESYSMPSGAPYCEPIDLDDFAFDDRATSLDKARWIAHRYWMSLAEAKELGYFDKKNRKDLTASDHLYYNEDGDESIKQLGRGYEGTTEEDYEEMVCLWEVWQRREGKILTLVGGPGGSAPAGADSDVLAVEDWLGPECGPYHFLCLGYVPGNAMPKAPIMDLTPLHTLVNCLYVKLGDQAYRQKSVLPIRGAQMDDAGRLKQASDGEMVACDSENPQEVSYGGPNALNLQFAVHAKDLFNAQAGNPDVLGGQGPQAKTATQEKIVNENASGGVADMQQLANVAMSKILSSYSWFLWYHPELVMDSQKEVPGIPEMSINRSVYPAGHGGQYGGELNRREGDFESMQIRVDPYSLQYKSPQQRLMFLDQTVKDLAPMMPMLAQSGVHFDAQAWLKLKAKYADEPDLLQIFTIGEPMAPPAGTGAGESRIPSETSREYIRRSVGQDTQAARESDLQNTLSQEAAQFSEGTQ